jgi:hypothetical protein
MTQFTTGVMALQVSPSTSGMLFLSFLESLVEKKSHLLVVYLQLYFKTVASSI